MFTQNLCSLPEKPGLGGIGRYIAWGPLNSHLITREMYICDDGQATLSPLLSPLATAHLLAIVIVFLTIVRDSPERDASIQLSCFGVKVLGL